MTTRISVLPRCVLFFGVLVLLSGAVVLAEAPRPEHPRPDFQRAGWLNLNGPWQFEIDAKGDGEARGLMNGHDLARQIVVPFCPESKLSDVGVTEYMPRVWYRRFFQTPAALRGGRLLLHFGAVDYLTRVWLNGELLGEHRGGFAPFSFEVTDLVRSGDNELVVQVADEVRSGLQPAGKQTHTVSQGCVYTRTTGIWQTVWLEAVGATYLKDFVVTPDLDGGRVLFTGTMDGPSKGVTVRVRALADGRQVAEETVPAAWRNTIAVLKLDRVVPWQPGKPFLYALVVEALRGGQVIDRVESYFGLRKIAIEGNRFLINDRPVFQRLVLDQGFYPDGIYTAPSDDALRQDVELSMAAGFNGARLHQKVFEPRLLYWADKLGYLVWGEFPSWGMNFGRPDAMVAFVCEWRDVLRRDRNHPSVIGWCPLNETNGADCIAWTQQLLVDTQMMDPTRPFLATSGYVHLAPQTDVYDSHDYTGSPERFADRYRLFGLTGQDPYNNFPKDPRSRYRGQPYFVSEYGGFRLKTDRDMGKGWGYNKELLSVEEFLIRYKGITDAQLDNPNIFGFCYTQLTDVEQEQNGVYYYDRKPKYDPALLRAINARPAAYEIQPPQVRHIQWTTLAPTSERSPQEWRYTIVKPTESWSAAEFNDTAWQSGKGGFGKAGPRAGKVGTE